MSADLSAQQLQLQRKLNAYMSQSSRFNKDTLAKSEFTKSYHGPRTPQALDRRLARKEHKEAIILG